MNNEKLWLQFWLLLAIVGAVAITSIVIVDDIYFAQVNQKIADMVAHGADPLRASCSLSGGRDICKIIAGRPQ